MLPINHGIVDTIEDFLQDSAPTSTGTQQKYRKLCLSRWTVVVQGFVLWLLLDLGHFSVVPFACSNKSTMSQKLASSGIPVFKRHVFTDLENAGFYDSIASWDISLSSERMTFA